MRSARLLLLFAVVASGLVAAPAEASPTKLVAQMRAEEVQPVPGPVGATGTAQIVGDVDTGRVCYHLTYDGPGTMTAAHIHRGEKGVNGPVTIALDVNAECVVPGAAPVKALLDWPDGYYVEIHTLVWQSQGAVRGQTAPG
ncbi:MAG TPA: CHRD domain-containing protein [Acidimicrobiia bacterium]|jgi:hypothetical protein|nr:CHRD domain-containing protein [Acidimicrobiia bacterium]